MKFIRVLKASSLEKDIEIAMESLRNDSENYSPLICTLSCKNSRVSAY